MNLPSAIEAGARAVCMEANWEIQEGEAAVAAFSHMLGDHVSYEEGVGLIVAHTLRALADSVLGAARQASRPRLATAWREGVDAGYDSAELGAPLINPYGEEV